MSKGLSDCDTLPVDESKFVYRLDSEGCLGHVELGGLLGEGVLLHQECHHVSYINIKLLCVDFLNQKTPKVNN